HPFGEYRRSLSQTALDPLGTAGARGPGYLLPSYCGECHVDLQVESVQRSSARAKKKSAMLQRDSPECADGVRHCPRTVSCMSKESAVQRSRACLSRCVITVSPYW